VAKIKLKVVPHLWYDTQAREAAEFYCSIFPDSKIRYVTTLRDTPSGDGEVVAFRLAGQPFMAISAGPHFKFNEAVSFMIRCDDQKEMDYYTNKLSAVPEAEQCGWIKDRFGLSWQVVPKDMDDMLQDDDEARLARVTQAMLKMKRLNLAELQRAYDGK
jgi:predicted 3-demethylubiquinone-9 3-methyltransferase (glyoxalase superfamily)